MKAVILPESAKSPNIWLRTSSGAMRASQVRLLAWAGPTNRPRIRPKTQNRDLEVTTSMSVPGIIRPQRDQTMTFLGPRRSSSTAKAAAPSPAVTFRPMP